MKKSKKKKILYSLYAAAFIGICLVPAVTAPFLGADGASEKRKLAEMPKLKNKDGGVNTEFFSEFESYFSEHFGLRSELVTLDGRLRSEVVKSSANEDVIIGRDGWLFYGDTADDFMNINTLSDRAIYNICNNLSMLNEYCKENNAQFLFTVAPNKNSIYSEYMPYNYIETDNPGNLEKFTAIHDEEMQKWMKLAASSQMISEEEWDKLDYFTYIDLKKALLEKKSETFVPIYHKTDTHWNNLGALAARDVLLSVSDTPVSFSDCGWSVKNDWSGDLAEMLYPSDVPADSQYYSSCDFTYQYAGRFKGFDDILIKTSCEGRNGKLLMYRDSFGEAIIPFMAESFESAEFSRTVPYRTDSIAEGNADTVILEIVERNLGNLQKYAPVMPAPECRAVLKNSMSLSFDGGYRKCSDFTAFVDDANKYEHIYGVLGEEFFSSDKSDIYVTVNNVTYKAFNAFEDELLGRAGEFCDRGFSLYIPKTEGKSIDISNIDITVVSDTGETAATGNID